MSPDPSSPDLARLVLSDRARDVVDDTLHLVPTLDDGQRAPGDLLLQALRVRAQVDKLVTAAVISAREHGETWSKIASVVGIRTESVTERWLPDEQRWRSGLANPIRQDGVDELPTLVLPQAAYTPEVYAADLDAWASRHIDEVEHERWLALGADPAYPVSGGLTKEPG